MENRCESRFSNRPFLPTFTPPAAAWAQTQRYFDGSIATTSPEARFSFVGGQQVEFTCTAVRDLKYTLQACPELGADWVSQVTLPPATDTHGRWTGPRPAADKGLYRAVRMTAP